MPVDYLCKIGLLAKCKLNVHLFLDDNNPSWVQASKLPGSTSKWDESRDEKRKQRSKAENFDKGKRDRD